MKLIKDDKAILSGLGFIIVSLFTLIIMIGAGSLVLTKVTSPLRNATDPAQQALSDTIISRGFTGIDLAGVGIPAFLVLGFLVYLILVSRSPQE